MCEATGTNEPPWTDPLAAVAASLPHDFKMEKWEQALRDVGEAAAGGGAVSALTRAGAACARLWSENAIFRLVQRVVLEDDRELLARVMPFIKCLNSYILEEKVCVYLFLDTHVIIIIIFVVVVVVVVVVSIVLLNTHTHTHTHTLLSLYIYNGLERTIFEPIKM